MIRPMKEFMIGVRSLAFGWQVWVLWLMALNFMWPLFLLDRIEAKVALLCFVVSAATGMALVHFQGFTRLVGAMHVFWIPLVVYLCMRLNADPADTFLGWWMLFTIVFNSISLIIDGVETARYLAGDRDPIV